jgi:glycosyltransferase involved in cell wall biosynthesis
VDSLGPLPQQHVSALIREATFSVLLREPRVFAQAGFPTKVPESLAVGTPVICNITSDLHEYVRDGIEGILCRDQTADAFAAAVERVLLLRTDQLRAMRAAARARAEISFDFRVYADTLSSLLDRTRL